MNACQCARGRQTTVRCSKMTIFSAFGRYIHNIHSGVFTNKHTYVGTSYGDMYATVA